MVLDNYDIMQKITMRNKLIMRYKIEFCSTFYLFKFRYNEYVSISLLYHHSSTNSINLLFFPNFNQIQQDIYHSYC